MHHFGGVTYFSSLMFAQDLSVSKRTLRLSAPIPFSGKLQISSN